MKARNGMIVLFAVMAVSGISFGATLRVPEDYPHPQEAIDAARDGDVISIAAGRYKGPLRIERTSLSIEGAGPESSQLSFVNHDGAGMPIISITGPAEVDIEGIEITGGEYDEGIGCYLGSASHGIVATGAALTLSDVVFNKIRNYMVTVRGGSLYARDVALDTDDWSVDRCDIGFRLEGCDARIIRLSQEMGSIDHTVDIVGTQAGARQSRVSVERSVIRASTLDWGDCVRVYGNSSVSVRYCSFYRATGGEYVPLGANHNGIFGYGAGVGLAVMRNRFENLPVGVSCCGEGDRPGGHNSYVLQDNTFIASRYAAVKVAMMPYEGVDLGGGWQGSAGRNSFSGSRRYDVELCHETVLCRPTGNVYALWNSWSGKDPERYIYDVNDRLVDDMGRVIATIPHLSPSR